MKFYKLQGAGNDFVFVTEAFEPDEDRIVFLCDRNFGVGADGVIMLSRGFASYDFNMRYFNSDGSEASFCANGGRCAVLLAARLGYFKGKETRFKAGDGFHTGRLNSDGYIDLQMKEPDGFSKDIIIKGVEGKFYHLDTGVDHAVTFVKDIDSIDVEKTGKSVRYNSRFPNGTNVNFVQKNTDGTFNIRTYERGVEAETMACGTGITASAYLDMLLTGDFSERIFFTVRDIKMKVFIKDSKLILSGPAELVFEGDIDI
jgi:diaminopimelate epimerase